MKYFVGLVFCLFSFFAKAVTVFNFSTVIDTVIEADSQMLLTKIVVTSPDTIPFSVQVMLAYGTTGDNRDIAEYTTQTIQFSANQDTANFYVRITDDCKIERLENLRFYLANPSVGTIGSNGNFNLYIQDNDLPAQFTFEKSVDTTIEHVGNYYFKILIDNPNPHPICYWSQSIIPLCTAVGGWDYFYDWQWHTAPPGLSVDSSHQVRLVNDTTFENLDYIYLTIIQDSVGNSTISPNAVMYLYIQDDDFMAPGTVDFIGSIRDTVWEDTATTYQVIIRAYNPNYNPLYCRVEPDFGTTTATYGLDFQFQPDWKQYPKGVTYDTMRLTILDDLLQENTENVFIKIRKYGIHVSTDSIYEMTIIDKDTVRVGFYGAAYGFIEGTDSVYKLKLVTTSPVPYPISADIKFKTGSVTPGSDFIFRDTTITFPANSVDTQYVYFQVLNDNVVEGNEQAVLSIENIQPNYVKTAIVECSIFILDDDYTSIQKVSDFKGLNVFPNPFSDFIYLQSKDSKIESFKLFNSKGQEITVSNDANNVLDTKNLPEGIYFLEVKLK